MHAETLQTIPSMFCSKVCILQMADDDSDALLHVCIALHTLHISEVCQAVLVWSQNVWTGRITSLPEMLHAQQPSDMLSQRLQLLQPLQQRACRHPKSHTKRTRSHLKRTRSHLKCAAKGRQSPRPMHKRARSHLDLMLSQTFEVLRDMPAVPHCSSMCAHHDPTIPELGVVVKLSNQSLHILQHKVLLLTDLVRGHAPLALAHAHCAARGVETQPNLPAQTSQCQLWLC